MRFVALALSLGWLSWAGASALAQPADNTSIPAQRQNLQNLLDSTITALRDNDLSSACQFRRQSLAILDANLDGFAALYPANNWSDLQRSLQGSVNKCAAKGL
ncbi:MAG: hypothetical protein VKM98_07650 [Cyanobacteriota bacterium]|nr:hypothetical protein [Cyanobacteriota bacterium]